MSIISDLAFSFVASRILTFRPKVWRDGDILVARSDWRTHVWTLGAYSRKVAVDPAHKTVRISNRSFWLFRKTRRLQFDWIEEILYSYGDLISPATDSWWSHQQADVFTVALQLKSGEVVKLFRFCGSGDFSHDGALPDWFYWGEMLEAKITKTSQDGESLLYVDLLAAMIDVPVGNPAP